MIVGYLLGLAFIPRFISQVTALRACTVLGVVGTLGVLFAPGQLTFLGLTAGLDRLGVSRVMVYMYLIPVAGVGLSAAFFGDPLTAARVLGGLVVLAGVILTRVALDRAARLPV